MTFAQLTTYLQDECGCHTAHIGGNFHLVRNCINGNPCVIQDLPFYDTPTLCHYFLELNVDIPDEYQDFYHIYMNFREHLKGIGIQEKKR